MVTKVKSQPVVQHEQHPTRPEATALIFFASSQLHVLLIATLLHNHTPLPYALKAGIRAYRSSISTGIGVSLRRSRTNSARSRSFNRSIIASKTSAGTL
ncbi:hypothetical protein D3C85_1545780 [compost metagenome]